MASGNRLGDTVCVPVYTAASVQPLDESASVANVSTSITIPVGVDLERFKSSTDHWVANAAQYIRESTPPDIDVEAIDWELIRVLHKQEMQLCAVLDMGILGRLSMVETIRDGWQLSAGLELENIADLVRRSMIHKLSDTYQRKRDTLLRYAVERMKQSEQAVYQSAH